MKIKDNPRVGSLWELLDRLEKRAGLCGDSETAEIAGQLRDKVLGCIEEASSLHRENRALKIRMQKDAGLVWNKDMGVFLAESSGRINAYCPRCMASQVFSPMREYDPFLICPVCDFLASAPVALDDIRPSV